MFQRLEGRNLLETFAVEKASLFLNKEMECVHYLNFAGLKKQRLSFLPLILDDNMIQQKGEAITQ